MVYNKTQQTFNFTLVLKIFLNLTKKSGKKKSSSQGFSRVSLGNPPGCKLFIKTKSMTVFAS